MRLEYVIVSIVIILIVLVVALTMLGGVQEGFSFVLSWFK